MPRATLSLPSSFTFSTAIPVRITDINYGGHLGNDALLAILHEARVRFLASHGYLEHDIEGVGIIMMDAVLLYRAEVFYGETLNVEVAVKDIQSHSCDIYYRVTSAASGKETARAKTAIAFFNYTTRKLVEVPAGFRAVSTHAGE